MLLVWIYSYQRTIRKYTTQKEISKIDLTGFFPPPSWDRYYHQFNTSDIHVINIDYKMADDYFHFLYACCFCLLTDYIAAEDKVKGLMMRHTTLNESNKDLINNLVNMGDEVILKGSFIRFLIQFL